MRIKTGAGHGYGFSGFSPASSAQGSAGAKKSGGCLSGPFRSPMPVLYHKIRIFC